MTDSEKLNLMMEKMTTLDEKVDTLDTKVNNLDAKVNSLDAKVNSLDAKVNSLDAKVNSLDARVTALDAKVVHLEADLQEVKQRVIKTELMVENEIRVNIQRVAEGHLDLSRKLNECIKLSNDVRDKQEIQDIYINMHNTRLKAMTI